MSNFLSRSTSAACGLLLTCAAFSAGATSFALQMGLDAGGETIATAIYDDGDSTNVKAGQLVHLAAGLIQPMSNQIELQATIGWKFDNAGASNGDISFDRFPLEGLLFFHDDRFRLGGGVTVHLAPSLEGSGAASSLGTVDFDDAIGFVGQIDMFVAPRVTIGLRGTVIDYETGVDRISVDGNSVGLVFTGRLD